MDRDRDFGQERESVQTFRVIIEKNVCMANKRSNDP